MGALQLPVCTLAFLTIAASTAAALRTSVEGSLAGPSVVARALRRARRSAGAAAAPCRMPAPWTDSQSCCKWRGRGAHHCSERRAAAQAGFSGRARVVDPRKRSLWLGARSRQGKHAHARTDVRARLFRVPSRPGLRNPGALAGVMRAPGWADLGDGARCKARPREQTDSYLINWRAAFAGAIGLRRSRRGGRRLCLRRGGNCARKASATQSCNLVRAGIPRSARQRLFPAAQEVWRRSKKWASRRGASSNRPRARYVRRCRVRHAGAGQFSLAQVLAAIHRGASACVLRSAASSQVLALPITRPRALPSGHWTLTAIASLLRNTPAHASVARGRFAGPNAPSARPRAPRRRGAGIGRWSRFAETSERAVARKVFRFHAA